MNKQDKDTAAETIVAVATPPGEGGIGIVRLSGPHALTIGKRLFCFSDEPKEIESYRLYTGTVMVSDGPERLGTSPGSSAGPAQDHTARGNGREIADRALFVMMRAPRSYTGEDVVELQCHGSPLLLSSLVTAAVSLGARPARPGEFTRRAFMNGKIDLVQAEAVADLIAAKTADGLSIFSRNLMGGLSGRFVELKGRLVSLLAQVEASIDFSDQDIDLPATEALVRGIEEVRDSVEGLLGSYRAGRIYREGARLVIAGRPNVGKSSLLNRLVGRPRAIVAPEPGTTTDTIEDITDIGGIPVRVVDTCGLREAAGAVEREGVERTREALASADVTLLVAEAAGGIGGVERGVIETAAGIARPVVLVMNKVDLVAGGPPAAPETAAPVVFTSALVGTGIEELKDAVHCVIVGGASRGRQDELITSARHYAALVEARQCLQEAHRGAAEGVSGEFTALDIRGALSALGEITGDVTTDEILEAIFSRFCVGK
jgi:tRNA modification GTPase